jgi:hypothetical protein
MNQYYGYKIVSLIDNSVLATFDDEITPDLTPGAQRRYALRVARKFRAQDHLVKVMGYMGGLGIFEMIDDGEDLTSSKYDFNSYWDNARAEMDLTEMNAPLDRGLTL